MLMMHDSTLADQPTADAVSVTLKEVFADITRYFQLAAERGSEDIEHVHQLRISARRATAALRIFKNFLRRKPTQQIERQIARLRKSGGALRDCDVFLTRFFTDPQNPVEPSLRKKMDELRASGQTEMLTLFVGWKRGEQLDEGLTDLLCSLRPRRSQAKRPAETFREFACRRLRRITKQFFASPPADTTSVKRLHAFRIRAKHLRYSLELLRPGLADQPFGEAYAVVKKLTQRLGEINDHATARCLLTRLRQGFSKGAETEWIAQTRRDESRSLSESLAEFRNWWSPRRQRRLRRRLERVFDQRDA